MKELTGKARGDELVDVRRDERVTDVDLAVLNVVADVDRDPLGVERVRGLHSY